MTLKALVIDIEDCKSSNNRVDNSVVISRTLLYTDIFIPPPPRIGHLRVPNLWGGDVKG